MKKNLLLIIMCIPVLLAAQQTNGVTVSNLAVHAGIGDSPTTVTFSVSWETPMPVEPWSDTVWVFVDYNNNSTMERLLLLPGATLTAASPGGKVIEENNKGVWVVGSAKTSGAGSFSATVQLLTAATNVAGACAYASNYRPVAEYTTPNVVAFTGTPAYNVILKHTDGSTTYTQSGSPFFVPSSYTLLSFTDKTGAPGIIKCMPMTGEIDFSVAPTSIAKSQPATFMVSVVPSAPVTSAITYTWDAQDFNPASFTGTPFTATAPATPKTYPVTLTARSTGYCDLTKTRQVAVADCFNPEPFNLIASASSFCVGDGITFALSGTEDGRNYQLYRGATPVGLINGDGGAATFSGTHAVAGRYTAASIADGVYCALSMTGSHDIAAYPALTAGEITTASTTTPARTDPEVTIESVANAQGGSGDLAYLWVRSGTSSATLTGSAATYAIDGDTYNTAGTYYINRYVKDNRCNTEWLAAAGTYTLEVLWTDLPESPCSYAQPAVVGTFAAFDEAYSADTYISLTDERDGKNYPVVKIGNWWVMAQNLNYQGVAGTSSSLTWQASAGSPTTAYSGNSSTATIGHFWCPGGYNTASTISTRASCDVWGALYSWGTAMMVDGKWSDDNRNSTTWSEPSYGTFTMIGNTNNGGRGARNHGICPPNWHVPTDAEWGEILNAMESESGSPTHNTGTGDRGIDAGRRGKSSCVVPDSLTSGNTYVNDTQANWYYNKNNASQASAAGTDNYKFWVLPAGYRNYNGSNFSNRGVNASFWSSSAQTTNYSWYRTYSYSSSSVSRSYNYRSYGYAVRCVKTPVLEAPTINVAGPTIDASKGLCKDTDAIFSIASPVSGATYTWSGASGTPSGAGNATYTVPAIAPGTINVSAYAVAPISGATYQSPVTEAYALVIDPVITAQSASRTVCRGKVAQFAVQSSTASSYQWRLNDANISGATASSYTSAAITANGTYSAVLANRCGSVTMNDILIAVNATATNFTAFNPTGSEPVGTTWCLADTRESNNPQTYTVRMMPDNRVWMVQDLKFGNKCTKTNFTPSSTVTGNQTSSKLTSISGYSYGDCVSSTYTTAIPNQGFFYDLAAAVQKANVLFLQSNSFNCTGSENPSYTCQGICPVGWHVPSSTEYTTAITASRNAYVINNEYYAGPYSLWEIVLAVAYSWEVYGSESQGWGRYPAIHTSSINEYNTYWAAPNPCVRSTATDMSVDSYYWYRAPVGAQLRCIKN